MFGFVLGTVCLLGLAAIGGGRCHGGRWEHREARWGHHGHGPCGHHGRGLFRGGRFAHDGFGRAAGEVLKRKLGIDEDQEGIVDHALADLRASLKELGEELHDTRGVLGDAFRGESVDDAALASAFARQDEAIGRARREIVSALKQIHAVLDPDQRARAADLVGAGEPRWV